MNSEKFMDLKIKTFWLQIPENLTQPRAKILVKHSKQSSHKWVRQQEEHRDAQDYFSREYLVLLAIKTVPLCSGEICAHARFSTESYKRLVDTTHQLLSSSSSSKAGRKSAIVSTT